MLMAIHWDWRVPHTPPFETKGDWRSWITFFGCMWSSEQWFISPNGRWPLQMLWIVAGEGANNLDCKGRRAQSGSKPWCQQVEWGGHASRVCFGCSCWKMLEDAGWKSLSCGSKVAVPVAAAILRDYYEIGRHQTNIIILKATFPYSENLRIPCFHRTPDLGFGMLLW